jgi:hypothetical protein
MLVLATSACSSSKSEDLYGEWITPGESLHVSFNEDDSWDVARRQGHPFGGGTFTFDGELLTFTTDPDNVTCPDKPGTYDAELTAEGNLELNVVEDTCRERARTLTGTLVPYSP